MIRPQAAGLALACLLACTSVQAQVSDAWEPSLQEEPDWVEMKVEPPALPRDEDLIEFYVGPLASNHFFVDGASIRVGEDGVVRYVLVIRTPSGAGNITFEGIRCASREVKLYAMGADGHWRKARDTAWKPVENKSLNSHHAALNRDYFCSVGQSITDGNEGRAALRRGAYLLSR
ncbi:CNP1-like family protein [Denitratisoma oestradiolicum]|uniref:CNP1-like uncharacterized domain-containing protein n=1 Tax=Denitratisoma oestradiolicum TaxID=311182 RepID=A0A6S6XRW5_9PROT|nr:CNP1-like family protein [Denitratisoma oestradiolicum]CAB1367465.1 conserved exported protein of unknown function [Denitratisoma oestradiolicum]